MTLVMHEGYGALAPVPPRYVAANDNNPEREQSAWRGAISRGTIPIGNARRGDFMQTFTARKFWPLDPRADEVCIEDIAHSLAMQCRYAGHCIRFYSVAEHSVHIAWWLFRNYGPEAALCGLLHDASEAYINDVIRPIKPFLSNYKEIEAGVMAAVREHFHLAEMPASVHEADTRIIGDEIANMVPMDWHARYDDPLNVVLSYWAPAEAEKRFLDTFRALTAECEAGRL